MSILTLLILLAAGLVLLVAGAAAVVANRCPSVAGPFALRASPEDGYGKSGAVSVEVWRARARQAGLYPHQAAAGGVARVWRSDWLVLFPCRFVWCTTSKIVSKHFVSVAP